nr:MAG TPA: hypothetical protein [Microviridae sp.]
MLKWDIYLEKGRDRIIFVIQSKTKDYGKNNFNRKEL